MSQDLGLGSEFEYSSLNSLTDNQGMRVIHEISIPCTCTSLAGQDGMIGSADPTCTQCYGLGYRWRDPRPYLGLIENASFNTQLLATGWVEPGDLNMEWNNKFRPVMDKDRITLTVKQPADPLLIVRGEASVMSPRPSTLADDEDFLFFEVANANPIWVEDEDGVAYMNGECILDGYSIKWIGSRKPDKGKKYVIKYETHPQYIVWSQPVQRWAQDTELGQRVILKALKFKPNGRQILTTLDQKLRQGNANFNARLGTMKAGEPIIAPAR